MDYKERYEQVLERAKKWHYAPNSSTIPTFANRIIEEIFPELKESEDEKIRKAVLGLTYLDGIEPILTKCSIKVQDIRAWLEKQGEQKPAEWSEEDESRLVSIENSLSDYLDYVREDNSLTKHQKKSTKEGVLEHVNWLKSLRPQKHWKPSEEQMEVFTDSFYFLAQKGFKDPNNIIESLWNDLKNLM